MEWEKVYSYQNFPGNYPSGHLNLEAVGSMSLPSTDDEALQSKLQYHALTTQLGSDKEELRHTILKQEVIFNNQVQELHRLYQRQMELMKEIEGQKLHKQSDHTRKMSPKSRELDSIPTRPHLLFDLNEPYQGDEAGTSNSVDPLGPVVSQGEIPAVDSSAKTNSGDGVSFKESFGDSETKKNLDACARPLEHPSFTNEAEHDRTVVDLQLQPVVSRGRPRKNLERNPMVILALPALNAPAPFNNLSGRLVARTRKTGSTIHVGGGSRCSLRLALRKSKTTSPGSYSDSKTSSTDRDFSPVHQPQEDHLKSSDKMDVKSDGDMDLNSIPPDRSIVVVSQQQICTMVKGNKSGGKHETDLNLNSSGNVKRWSAPPFPVASVLAPISPENQEHPPPRGASEEVSLGLVHGKGTGALKKRGRITAEEPGSTSSGIEAGEGSDSLYWFATFCLDFESGTGLAVGGSHGDEQEELPCADADYIEAMRLKLAELMAVEHEGEDSGEKGRGQKKILPSLAFLTRHEGVKARASPPGTKFGNANGNKQARGRKRPRASALNAAENKHPAANAEQGPEDGGQLTRWGNVRRRAQRYRGK